MSDNNSDIMDYAQNLDIPHFGEEQPGATYYFSPCPKPDDSILVRHKDSVEVKRHAKAAEKRKTTAAKKSTAAATSIL